MTPGADIPKPVWAVLFEFVGVPTVYGIYETREEARGIARKLKQPLDSLFPPKIRVAKVALRIVSLD